MSGRTDDGTVEACEDPSAPFVLGVQWHPEALDDLAVFQGLVESCRTLGADVSGADRVDLALRQVDRRLRPREPVPRRQSPVDPQQDQRAADDDGRVVDELHREVLVHGMAAGVNGRMK